MLGIGRHFWKKQVFVWILWIRCDGFGHIRKRDFSFSSRVKGFFMRRASKEREKWTFEEGGMKKKV